MEESLDHILPKPESMPEPVAATSEAEIAPEVIPEHAETEIPAEQTASAETKAVSKRQSTHSELEILLERIPGYLSVKEAAGIMGVSERSVYGYIGAGKLPGARIGNIIVVVEEYVEAYERKGPGRARTTAPFWRVPPLRNLEWLTTIIARIRPERGEQLEQRLYEIRTSKKHHLLGTAARYIARNRHDPNEIEIVLIWRNSIMPSLAERESALAAFYEDLADIIDWETVSRKEGRVLLHA